MFRHLFILVLLSFFLAGCDQKAVLQHFVPRDDDTFARHFIDSVRTGDYPAAELMLDASIRNEKATGGLHSLHDALAHRQPISVEVISFNALTFTSSETTTRKSTLSYQIHFPNSWAVGDVYLVHNANTFSVLGSHFRPTSDSLEVLNRFNLSGQSPIHYLVLAACVVIPTFILLALFVCIRTRVRRKWLWIFFILFGVFQLRLD